MAKSFISAVEMLMSMQRWNFLPRIETWTEAENAAYVAHLGYATAREMGEDDGFIRHLILRTLLQSFTKYELSDIPRHTVETLEEIPVKGPGTGRNYYDILRDDAVRKIAPLFPRPIGDELSPYMKARAEFGDEDPETARRIENLFNYCKRRAALEECLTNKKIYERAYKEREAEIRRSISEIPGHEAYEQIVSNYEEYFLTVRNLKYLIRWNRIKRSLESSVLAHTYAVALLAAVYSLYEEKMFAGIYEPHVFDSEKLQLDAVLLSLFHDILESLTGDVITPVKHKINDLTASTERRPLWDQVEDKHREIIKKTMPPSVKKDAQSRGLLDELAMDSAFSVSSFTKQCDMLALVIECVSELRNNPAIPEMRTTANDYIERLRNSEWFSLRQLAQEIGMEYPEVLRG
jgi:putative hydrolase of HD superfamily